MMKLKNLNKKQLQKFLQKEEKIISGKKKQQVLKSFSNKNNFILSVGGGTPCFNNNMDWMNENGITIWIDEPIEIIEKRLLKEKSHRPLIANIPDENLYTFLSDMHKKRSVFYKKAKHHFKQDDISEQNFLKIILNNE